MNKVFTIVLSVFILLNAQAISLLPGQKVTKPLDQLEEFKNHKTVIAGGISALTSLGCVPYGVKIWRNSMSGKVPLGFGIISLAFGHSVGQAVSLWYQKELLEMSSRALIEESAEIRLHSLNQEKKNTVLDYENRKLTRQLKALEESPKK